MNLVRDLGRRSAKASARCLLLALFLWMGCSALGAWLLFENRESIKTMDQRHFDQRFLDWLGRVVLKERWEDVPSAPRRYDYTWLSADSALPLQVAHAMGSGGDDLNTLAALDRSIAQGFTLIEADFWLSEDDELFCFHGPVTPVKRTSAQIVADFALRKAEVCRFSDVARFIKDKPVYLILDIKTPFYKTGAALLDEARKLGVLGKIIFQLYRPTDVEVFFEWSQRYAELPGPIITAYLSRRALKTLAHETARIGFKSLTFPYKLLSLKPRDNAISYFVHALDSCDEVLAAEKALVRGYYIHQRMECHES